MKYVKVKDLGQIVTGNTPSTSDMSNYGDFMPFIKATDIILGSRYTYNTEQGYSEKSYKKYKVNLVPKGSTCIVTIGSIGKKMTQAHTDLFVNQAINAILPYKQFDKDYIYYVSKYAILPQLKIYDSGTTSGRENISKSSFSNIKLFVEESLSKQQKIASILSTYDTLIENNYRRIRLLEQMAENLYKEWFVRFRFPGHEKVETEKSKYGKVPSTFKFIKMQEAFDYYIGGGWGEEEKSDEFPKEASVIRGADFPKIWQYDISTCPLRFHKTKNYKARQLEDGDVIMEISGGTSEQPVGRVVLITQELLDRFENGKVICASFCKLIRLQKNIVSPYYFYYWLRFLYDTRIIDRYQLQSTGIINFKFEPFLRKGDIMLPPQNIMEKFAKQVGSLHKEMNKLAHQNTLLTRQRDLLLPRLMSGKLEVKP